MTVLQAILLGAVAGITGVIPVSSSGHVMLLGELLQIPGCTDLQFLSFLHIGTLTAIISVFYKDLLRLLLEVLRMISDVLYNFRIYLTNKRSEETIPYQKVISNYYRRFALFVLIALVPAIVISLCMLAFVQKKGGHMLVITGGFLVTALMLLVSSMIPRNEKGPKEAKISDAFLIGCFQGFTPIPGVSRLGVSVASGFMNGFSRKFTMKFAYILAVPMILGSLILSGAGKAGTMTVAVGPCVAAVFVSCLVGIFAIRIGIKIISKIGIRFVACYCIVMSIVSIAAYLN